MIKHIHSRTKMEILTQELIEANTKLAVQNSEKEKRASELIIANKELVYQNNEKEKRALELIVANKELIYQNSEKEKRASELLVANEELKFQNIEKEKRLKEIVELKDSLFFIEKQLFEKTLLSIGDGVISTDQNSNIVFMNKIAEILSGWTSDEAIGRPIYQVFNIMNEFTRTRNEDIVQEVILTKEIHNLSNHTILITKKNYELLIEDSAAPILNKEDKVVGVVIVFRDYTEKWERLKKIEYINFHDDLTGLYNRRFFEEELIRVDNEINLPISIIMGDINGLKLVNDSFGHEYGDELLVKTSESLKEVFINGEIIARVGGDEFVIILLNTSPLKLPDYINRIKNSLKNKHVYGIELSISFGFGTKDENTQNIQKILKESEDFMYQHKLYESSSMHSNTISIITKTLFEKNNRELIHSRRVSEYTGLLCEELNFDKERVNILKIAGLMHDIGKIGIVDSILNKEGQLNQDELIEIHRHPEIGSRILNSIKEFSELSIFVLQHHERWDGSGYPQGLKGEEISIEARIITLADAYDAMTGFRTYHQAMNKVDALNEIEKNLGTQFDPIIGKRFIELIKFSDK